MTGKHVSRKMEDILEEIRNLVSKGVREVQLIAQDLSYYGRDRYKTMKLAELVDQIAQIPGLVWLRLHYTYPYEFPMDLLPVMRKHTNVCSYLDMALQHISDPMLEKMRRKITRSETLELLQNIRKEVPGIHIRTTLLVGHPGETEDDFQQLCDFVKEQRFERLGAFLYSDEEGTYAARKYEDDVPEKVKRSRLDRLMALQQDISAELNTTKIGQSLLVVVDREEPDHYVGRTEFDSPDVDPEVFITKEITLEIGSFYTVEITSSGPYDLFGKIPTHQS
jgi:ribosomal protein S12 methylthiotransferase